MSLLLMVGHQTYTSISSQVAPACNNQPHNN
uniref:Uncharacterized protein n=1 Tax=Anguilla anguilla TaxID=7936 RepID=A0A0E9V459_ANGAN